MKILLITNYYPPEIGAASHLLYDLSEDLVKYGHRVRVVTNFPKYNLNRIPDKYKMRSLFLKEALNGIEIIRTNLTPFYGTSPFTRGISHFSSVVSHLLGSLLCNKPDVVYIYSPPLTLGITGYVLKRLKEVPIIFNVQDIFPANAIDLGILKNRFLIGLFHKIENFVYKNSTFITVHSEGNRNYLITKKALPPFKVCTIPNWVDTQLIYPSSKNNEFCKEHGLENYFVVLFAGVMGWSQGLDVVVKSADLLKNYTDILFLLVGEGVGKKRLLKMAVDLKLNNIKFLPMQPREKYPLVVSTSDVCLVTLREVVKTPVVPSKILGIMASGRAIVASLSLDGDAAKIINEANAGICVPPEDPKLLSEAILKLYKSPTLREKLGMNGRNYVVDHFSRKICTKRYEELFINSVSMMREKKL